MRIVSTIIAELETVKEAAQYMILGDVDIKGVESIMRRPITDPPIVEVLSMRTVKPRDIPFYWV